MASTKANAKVVYDLIGDEIGDLIYQTIGEVCDVDAPHDNDDAYEEEQIRIADAVYGMLINPPDKGDELMLRCKAMVQDTTQVLIDTRNDINARKAQLIRDVVAFLESLIDNPSKLRQEAWAILSALERDLIVTIARNIGIETEILNGFIRKPIDTSRIRKQIINHYACPAGRA